MPRHATPYWSKTVLNRHELPLLETVLSDGEPTDGDNLTLADSFVLVYRAIYVLTAWRPSRTPWKMSAPRRPYQARRSASRRSPLLKSPRTLHPPQRYRRIRPSRCLSLQTRARSFPSGCRGSKETGASRLESPLAES